MIRRTLTVVLVAASFVVSDAVAQTTVRSMYLDAFAREEAVRSELAVDQAGAR